MNYVKLIVESNVSAGDIVSFNNSKDKWEKSNTASEIIGQVCNQPEINDTGLFEAFVNFDGILEAIALNDIPPSGGPLGVSNGKVYVDEELQDTTRFVLPNIEKISQGNYCKIKL